MGIHDRSLEEGLPCPRLHVLHMYHAFMLWHSTRLSLGTNPARQRVGILINTNVASVRRTLPTYKSK